MLSINGVLRCFIFLGLFVLNPGQAQIMEKIEISETCSYYGEKLPEIVTTFASDKEAENTIDDIVNASGLSKNFRVHAAGVPNAAAVIRNGERYILYNQYFMSEVRGTTRSEWAAISIMAHEVGHHLNGHTLDDRGSRPDIELEADYYSGFVLQKLGASIDDSRVAMKTIASEVGSSTHPAKYDRLAAITSGWKTSCDKDPNCGKRSDQSRTNSRETPRSSEQKEDITTRGNADNPWPTPSKVQPVVPKRRTHPTNGRSVDTIYCCDQYGRKVCSIAVNPGPLGSACWCSGVYGSGMMCN